MILSTRTTGQRPADGHDRRGFTLIELMAAVMILTVGLLGLAATSGAVMRQIGGGAQATQAATLAQSRLESLHGMDCTTLSAGAATTRGITESWTSVNGSRTVTVTNTVSYVTHRGTRSHTFTSMIPCAALP